MAERRMFTKKVTDDDNFMTLSSSAQALYLHLSMAADDDGFCNQVTLAMFKAHASVQDLEALLEKRYIYQFENGVIVIKHWRMANALRKDRYTKTNFLEELDQLCIKENGEYDWLPSGCRSVATCLPQDRIGKDRIGEDRIGEDSVEEIITAPVPPSYGTHHLVTLTDAELNGLINTYGKATTEDYIQQLDAYMFSSHKQYSSHYQTIIRWIEKAKRDETYRKPKKTTFNNLEQRQDTDYDKQAYSLAEAQRKAWNKKKEQGNEDNS